MHSLFFFCFFFFLTFLDYHSGVTGDSLCYYPVGPTNTISNGVFKATEFTPFEAVRSRLGVDDSGRFVRGPAGDAPLGRSIVDDARDGLLWYGDVQDHTGQSHAVDATTVNGPDHRTTG